jgi:hypothetical protein
VLLASSVLHVTEYVPHSHHGSDSGHDAVGLSELPGGGGHDDAGSPDDPPPADHQECMGIRWAADSSSAGTVDGLSAEAQPIAWLSRERQPETRVQPNTHSRHVRTGRAILSTLCVVRT